jgi:hypothetical protein
MSMRLTLDGLVRALRMRRLAIVDPGPMIRRARPQPAPEARQLTKPDASARLRGDARRVREGRT